ncbi:MAG: hypothetical protein AXA67_02180 [Methylothermaceae bacteria B42]|nr:MAG: hypothetical protein AXA67_02180 [Methylothermaceae bacteria B42]HHJ40070.1 hypothetical protein [Methylothermaceae bacterium]
MMAEYVLEPEKMQLVDVLIILANDLNDGLVFIDGYQNNPSGKLIQARDSMRTTRQLLMEAAQELGGEVNIHD